MSFGARFYEGVTGENLTLFEEQSKALIIDCVGTISANDSFKTHFPIVSFFAVKVQLNFQHSISIKISIFGFFEHLD